MASGWHLTEETRTKMSIAAMGNKRAAGHKLSLESRTKISIAKCNPSAETREKLSKARWKGGRSATMRRFVARRRQLGFIPLNKPFPGCEGHHIDHEYIVYIPKELHHSVYHCLSDERKMGAINALAFEWLAQNP